MLDSDDMKDMVAVLGDVVKPEPHEHILCSTLQLPFQNKPAALKQKEVQKSTGENSGNGESKKEEGENVELQPEFEVMDSELHYIRAIEIYQQNLATKRAAQRSVAEINFLSWQLKASWGELN